MLKELVRVSRRNAFDHNSHETIKKARLALVKSFLGGEITLRDYNREDSLIVNPGELLFDSKEDFQEALIILGLPQEIIDESISHEEKHVAKANTYGMRAQWGVCLVSFAGRLGHFRNAFTALHLPDDLDDDFARLALREIIEAPGKDMSPTDIEMIAMED